MHIVGPEVDIKRLPGGNGALHEGHRGIDKTATDLRALHPDDRSAEALGIGPDAARFPVARLEGERQQLGTHALKIRQAFVEAVGRDRRRVVDIALAAEMPLAEVAGGVAARLQQARQGRRLRIEPLGDPAALVVGAVVQVGGDAPALRVLAGGEGATRG